MTYPDETTAQRTAEPTGGVLELPKRVFRRFKGEADVLMVSVTFVSYAMRFVSNIILSYLLFPQAFGQVAIVSTILAGVAMLLDVGMFYAVVSHKGEMDRDTQNRFWTLQLIRGSAIGLIAMLASPAVAAIYGDPVLLLLLIGASFNSVIAAMASIGPMLAMREGRPAYNMAAGLIGQVSTAAISILSALIIKSPWALIIGTLCGTLTVVLFTHWREGRLPRFNFDGAFLMNQLRFMRWFQITSTLYFLGSQIDKLVFPLLFGTTLFGVYAIAQTLALIPTQIGHRWIHELLMPAVQRIIHDGDPVDHPDATRPRVTGLLYLGLMCAGIVGASGPFFTWLYPAAFHQAALFCPLLAIVVFAGMSELSLRQGAFLVTGRQKYEALGELIRTIFFLSLVYGFMRSDPDPMLYIALLLVAQITTWIGFIALGRYFRITRLRIEARPALAFVLMSVLFYTIGRIVDEQAGPIAALACLTVAGAGLGALIYRRLGLPKAYRSR